MKRFINGSLIKMCTLNIEKQALCYMFSSSSLEYFKVTDYTLIVKMSELKLCFMFSFHVSSSYYRPAYLFHNQFLFPYKSCEAKHNLNGVILSK